MSKPPAATKAVATCIDVTDAPFCWMTRSVVLLEIALSVLAGH